MCGIVGVVSSDPRTPMDRELLVRMRDRMRHRGPDGEGIHLAPGVALGHRRLSIVDLEGGAQPMPNEDGTILVSYNGELYNHVALREALIGRGHIFRTRSDTEAIVHLYEEVGDGCVDRMTGMFAFAVWDARRHRCLLARDRLGIKPLYYWQRDGVLIFASEIKAILEHPWVSRELDPGVLREYLTFRYVSGSRTFLRGIRRLLPGHRLVWEGGHIRVERYWDVPKPEHDRAEDEPFEHLHALIAECVSSHRMSDVPLGAFCSGGVDSGVVTALLAREAPQSVHTFAVGFEEREWDERADAAEVAAKLGTIHHEFVMGRRAFADTLARANWHLDEPLSHPNSVPLLLLSEFAKQFVTVVLTGEGSDEVFGGYPRYLIAGLHERLARGGRSLPHLFGFLLGHLPLRRARKLGAGLLLEEPELCVYSSAYVEPELVKRLCPGRGAAESIDHRFEQLEHLRSRGFRGLDLLMAYETRTYLPCALDRMDKMSMAASLEARVPFVDHRLVEYGLSMRVEDRVRGATNKYAVKKIAESYIPRGIIYKRKSGFGIPIGDWFRGDPGLQELLASLRESTVLDGYIDARVSARLLDEHLRGVCDHSESLWLLLNLTLWADVMLRQSS